MIPLVKNTAARTPQRALNSWWRGPVRWIVAVLALMAAIDAWYLTYTSLNHSVVAGCNAVSIANCDLVLSSPWSRWVFLPVALGGALCYTGIFVLSLLAGRLSGEVDHWAGTLLVMLSIIAAASGLWFLGVQIFALGAICLHCIATHLCGLVIAGLVLFMAFRSPPASLAASRSHVAMPRGGPRVVAGSGTPFGPSLGFASAGATVFVLLLITGQVFFSPQTYEATKVDLDESIDMTAAADSGDEDSDGLSPAAQTHVVNRVDGSEESTDKDEASATNDDELAAEVDSEAGDDADDAGSDTRSHDEAPALAREVKFLNGRVKVNIYNEAVIGSPEAPYVILELIDYTCPHCREMHARLKKAKERYGDQLAIVIMPVPLEMECNKRVTQTDPLHRGACRMSRIALAVAKLDPEVFVDFHNWLMANKENPPTGVQTLNRAWALVDQRELSKLTNGDEIKKRIEKYIKFFNALSNKYATKEKPFGLPVQVVGDTVFTGKFDTDEEMYEAWEKAIDIKPR